MCPNSESCPTAGEFLEEVGKETKWYSLGVHLKVSISDLNEIEKQHQSHGSERCVIQLYEQCMNMSKQPSWKDIAIAYDKYTHIHIQLHVHAYAHILYMYV